MSSRPSAPIRLAIDTGGTFTDLAVMADSGLRLFKHPTTPDDPVDGIVGVLELAASGLGVSLEELLGRTELCLHGTTRPVNAIVTQTTARTALLVTEGHRDILLIREGGRHDPFAVDEPYPEPYVPRALTYEVPERVGASGEVVTPLDEAAVASILAELRERDVEAVAVCFLWSIVNPDHEARVGALIDELLPGVPFTLSHRLNPIIREYRRCMSTAIDASLKPLMAAYLEQLERRLRELGLTGRLLIVTSAGGVQDIGDVSRAPIHAVGSGPAMAPVAAQWVARSTTEPNVIATDAGGTTYDVSLVRSGSITRTKETWLGRPHRSHLTGFPSVDVRSVGAGGGSIASVDEGGLLHVGPDSAGAEPGPVCYGRGGGRPTVTDAALVLGYLDPERFLDGGMGLQAEPAARAIDRAVGDPLDMPTEPAAGAILDLVTEHMAGSIKEVCLSQGVDPRTAALVAGGGAAGLNVLAVARRLGCPAVVIPDFASGLSAVGALLSDLTAEYSAALFARTSDLDLAAVRETLRRLTERCDEFREGPGRGSLSSAVEYVAEGRYPQQVWDVEMPLAVELLDGADAPAALREEFHRTHRRVFAVADTDSEVEFVGWRARVRCKLVADASSIALAKRQVGEAPGERSIYFRGHGWLDTPVIRTEGIAAGSSVVGPAVIEAPLTTVVVEPGAEVERLATGMTLARPALADVGESATVG